MKNSDKKLKPVTAWLRFTWKHSTHPLIHATHRFMDAVFMKKAIMRENNSVKIAYVGSPKGITHGFNFLCEQLESETGTLTLQQRWIVPWRRQHWIRKLTNGTDLLMTGGTTPLKVQSDSGWFVMPMRIHYNVELTPDIDPLELLSKQTKKNHQRDMKRRNWQTEISRDDADFWFFYEQMHLPTMQYRHGEQTRTDDLNVSFHELFRKGFVFFLTHNGVRTAGVVCRENRAKKILSMRLAGVLQADTAYYRDGTFLALYVLLIRWAHTNGYRRVELSGSEPFMSKGLHQFKRTLGPSLMAADNQYASFILGLRTTGENPAIKALLVKNPLVTFVEYPLSHAFRGVFFRDPTSPEWELGWKTTNLEEHNDVWLPMKVH